MKARKRRNERLGKIAFFVPLIVILSLVIYGFFQITAPGTLTVEAQVLNKYTPTGLQTTGPHTTSLAVSATVGATTETTPFSLSLSAGTYDVTFGSNPWYVTPSPHTVDLLNGRTAYVTGSYLVVARVISLTRAGFNSTSVSALHGVTPVIWVNNLNTTVVIGVEPYGNEALEPGQNFTAIYQNTGDFQYASPVGGATSSSGTVTVT